MRDRDNDQADITLWHYTDAVGLLGIINGEHKRLRATGAWYLNDSSEMKAATTLAVGLLDQALEATDDAEKTILEGALKRGLERIARVEEIYVSCFSTNPDDLSQWRAYGNGAGYALAFKNIQISRCLTDPDMLTANLVQCIYRPEDKSEAIRELISRGAENGCREQRERAAERSP